MHTRLPARPPVPGGQSESVQNGISVSTKRRDRGPCSDGQKGRVLNSNEDEDEDEVLKCCSRVHALVELQNIKSISAP
ncbi:hypothetical protein Baya_7118 [Bagarius yarrelli]|uniref:Uncharacterized protein n=1 Tax=Bagarius yarrelli TaxID=175774 RepID=A0A556TZB8_BAGYA|nr:hypothetical protein Baya_7118 [Bagarius yarrelli]